MTFMGFVKVLVTVIVETMYIYPIDIANKGEEMGIILMPIQIQKIKKSVNRSKKENKMELVEKKIRKLL